MLIYPAIDMYEQKAVRLYKGDYAQMTVYSENPCAVAQAFKDSGATHIHLVDLEGAKAGTTPNFGLVKAIKAETGLFCEIGGGIRDMDTIKKYVDAGIDRVILGTAAVTSAGFVEEAVKAYGDKSPWALTSRTATLPSKAGPKPPRKRPWTSPPKCRPLASGP